MTREDFVALQELYRLLNMGHNVKAKIQAFHAKASRASSGCNASKDRKGTFNTGECLGFGSYAPTLAR